MNERMHLQRDVVLVLVEEQVLEVVSCIGIFSGAPYVAAVEENTILLTPAFCISSSKIVVFPVLFM